MARKRSKQGVRRDRLPLVDDIVERLREGMVLHAPRWSEEYRIDSDATVAMLNEAADKIEQLQDYCKAKDKLIRELTSC